MSINFKSVFTFVNNFPLVAVIIAINLTILKLIFREKMRKY